MIFIEQPNDIAQGQLVVDEEIADRDGSLAFRIERRGIQGQRKAISAEPKPFSDDRYHEISVQFRWCVKR